MLKDYRETWTGEPKPDVSRDALEAKRMRRQPSEPLAELEAVVARAAGRAERR
ncbi:hypothetical protein JQC91_01950 [Jannaschia sp. Os4]|uniref:hypothetical protein n=1 Tax=Jannaschia sp. Os4 TaxID=2807617 RepID=UPI001939949F|nr:hypothetical protein [Jannaschia sp. Os4]MBM2575056.1 hypothetical protein [Jannaschia sp. Os4]